MKTVFVLVEWTGYEDIEIKGVFNTMSAAIKRKEEETYPGNCEIYSTEAQL